MELKYTIRMVRVILLKDVYLEAFLKGLSLTVMIRKSWVQIPALPSCHCLVPEQGPKSPRVGANSFATMTSASSYSYNFRALNTINDTQVPTSSEQNRCLVKNEFPGYTIVLLGHVTHRYRGELFRVMLDFTQISSSCHLRVFFSQHYDLLFCSLGIHL